MKKIYLLVIAVFFIYPIVVKSQTTTGDFEGTDFWLGFSPNSGNGVNSLIISSRMAATVTVSIPKITGAFTQTVNVAANSSQIVNLPTTSGGTPNTTLVAPAGNTVYKTGIHVTSTAPVSVYGYSIYSGFNADSWLTLPTANLGNEYVTIAFDDGLDSQVLVVATEDGTTVNYSLPTGVTVTGKTNVFSQTLNQGELYLIQGAGASLLNGIKITSNKNIAVFGGSAASLYPACAGLLAPNDYLVEMLIPATAWGSEYVLVPYSLSTNCGGAIAYYRVISNSATPITINASVGGNITLNSIGANLDRALTAPVVLTSTQKKYTVVELFGANPSFSDILPVEQWGVDYSITTMPSFTGAGDNKVIIIKKSNAGKVSMDGTNQTGFTQIGTSVYYYKDVVVAPGNHIFTGDSVYTIYSYGYKSPVTYCHPASGGKLAPIAVLPIDLISFTGKNDNGTVNLHWATASEQNSKSFYIEKYTTSGYQRIGTIDAAGNSNSRTDYQFTDRNAILGENFYRLTQEDFDGKTRVSGMVTVKVGHETIKNLTTFTENGEVTLRFNTNKQGTATINIIDILGKKVYEANYNIINEGSQEIKASIWQLPLGSYFVTVQMQNEITASTRFLKTE